MKDVLFDPIRQPRLYAHQCAKRRAKAEETNQVFRQAVGNRPAIPMRQQRNRFVAALFAAAMAFGRERAR